jgi:hypothetical protein
MNFELFFFFFLWKQTFLFSFDDWGLIEKLTKQIVCLFFSNWEILIFFQFGAALDTITFSFWKEKRENENVWTVREPVVEWWFPSDQLELL